MSVVDQETNDRRSQPLDRLAAQRATEEERGRSERSYRVRSATFGFLIGGLLGLFVGHMGLLILEAREEFLLTYYWTRELIAFDDQRPLIPTYFIGGGLAGALVCYQFLVVRYSMPSFRGWAIGAAVFAFGSVFFIGYFAALVIVNVLDPVTLDPNTWPMLGDRAAWAGIRFVLSLVGAILSSFSVMGGAFYVSFVSTGIFLLLWIGTKVALDRTAHMPPLAGRIPLAPVTYASSAALAAVPYLVSIAGPESLMDTLVHALSSLETLQP